MIHPTPYSGPAFAGRRIGLLGGSFNPAHDGHVAMSLHALKRLQLDGIWWLVSPQNPLKPKAGMKPFAERLRYARSLTKNHPLLCATGLEAQLGTRYTVDTIRALQTRMPGTRFVWLMGADNLRQIDQWRHWKSLFQMVPIAVFRRPGYAADAASCLAAQRFAAARQRVDAARHLALMTPPAWLMLDNKYSLFSATQLRQRGKNDQQTGKER